MSSLLRRLSATDSGGSHISLPKLSPDRRLSRSKVRSRATESERLRDQWHRVHLHLQSASAAFSAAGQERREAFQQRKWYTIAGTDAAEVGGRALTDEGPGDVRFTRDPPPWSDLYLPTPRAYSRKDKSVSFEDEHLAGPSGNLSRLATILCSLVQ